jgi:uncharacterized protein YcbK (DUF882 family)
LTPARPRAPLQDGCMKRPAIALLAALALVTSGMDALAQLEARSRSANMAPPDSVWRLGDPNDRAPRILSFVNLQTKEVTTAVYRSDGVYLRPQLDRLDGFLRDRHSGTKVALDPRLYDVLWLIQKRLGSKGAWHVASAYRSPRTNAWLATTTTGVARDSLHMRGQAIDVMLPGYSVEQIRAAAAALGLGLGGIGTYPQSGFVHIDTGALRQWNGGS